MNIELKIQVMIGALWIMVYIVSPLLVMNVLYDLFQPPRYVGGDESKGDEPKSDDLPKPTPTPQSEPKPESTESNSIVGASRSTMLKPPPPKETHKETPQQPEEPSEEEEQYTPDFVDEHKTIDLDQEVDDVNDKIFSAPNDVARGCTIGDLDDMMQCVSNPNPTVRERQKAQKVISELRNSQLLDQIIERCKPIEKSCIVELLDRCEAEFQDGQPIKRVAKSKSLDDKFKLEDFIR